jgi:hypothetical protein
MENVQWRGWRTAPLTEDAAKAAPKVVESFMLESCRASTNKCDYERQDHGHEQRQTFGPKPMCTYYIHIVKSISMFRSLVMTHVVLGADRLNILHG